MIVNYIITMKSEIFIGFVFFLFVNSTSAGNENRRIFEEVGNRLKEFEAMPRNEIHVEGLPNTDKLGVGYNILAGSPACYSGVCQTNEFTRSIFKLNYVAPEPLACTNKSIPEGVQLECFSPALITNTEVIDTFDKLYESISKRAQVSVDSKYQSAAFSYVFSRQTQHMIDNIAKENRTAIFTSAEALYIKLSMFEPSMELSENFQYVIEHMPCCTLNSLTEDYVKTYITNYFGFAYISSIFLGGVAQQNIFVTKTSREKFQNQGIQILQEARESFIKDLKYATASSDGINVHDSVTFNLFNQEIQSKHTVTFGGVSYFNTLEDWLETIANNPVVIKYEVQDIFRLFTSQHFPSDPLITNKSKLIEAVVNKQLQNSVYCYGDCGGNGIRGTCMPTGYFQFGICKCNPGWTGFDCQTVVPTVTTTLTTTLSTTLSTTVWTPVWTPVWTTVSTTVSTTVRTTVRTTVKTTTTTTTTTTPPPMVLHGTICGFDRSIMKVGCDGHFPFDRCPSGWNRHVWTTDLTVCYKYLTEFGSPLPGTLCGLHSYQEKPSPFSYDINCQYISSVVSTSCPNGYQLHQTNLKESEIGSITYKRRNAICTSLYARQALSGTLCGMQATDTMTGPSCAGYNPVVGQCPYGYAVRYTAFNDKTFAVCVKL